MFIVKCGYICLYVRGRSGKLRVQAGTATNHRNHDIRATAIRLDISCYYTHRVY